MGAPFFTTNDSEITLLEGLYIKEKNPPATIAGVSLNKVCMVGESIRGPANRAISISNETRFVEVFGGRDQGNGGDITSNLWKSLLNKPFGRMEIVRVVASDAVAASLAVPVTGAEAAVGSIQCIAKADHVDGETLTISDGVHSAKVFEFDVAGDGVTGGRVAVDISGATTAPQVANILVTAINNASNLDIVAVHNTNDGLVLLTNTGAGAFGNVSITDTVSDSGFVVTGMEDGADAGASLLQVDATSAGEWGNNVDITVAAASDGDANHFNLTVTYLGKDYIYKNLDISTGNDNTASVLGDDEGNIVVLTKLADGVPAPMSATAMQNGSDGTVVDADYTGTGKALEVAAVASGCGVVAVAEHMSAAIKAKLATLAAASTDRLFLMAPDSETVSKSTAISEVASYRSDRIVYCFNHAYTLDPDTATQVISSPDMWMASILSQVDVDVNPGEEAAKQFTAGITKLYNEALARGDYIDLKDAGIAALEKDEGFAFVSAITTSLESGKDQITRRRMADYLQLSIAKELKHSVKKKNTVTRRKANAAMISAFLNDLARAERIVDTDATSKKPAFSVDTEKLNSDAQRALGVERILMRVKLIGHMLFLVLETEIGTSVNISEK